MCLFDRHTCRSVYTLLALKDPSGNASLITGFVNLELIYGSSRSQAVVNDHGNLRVCGAYLR